MARVGPGPRHRERRSRTRPVIWTTQADLEAGENVADENARLRWKLFAGCAGLPREVETARAADGAVTLVLGNGLELRLGRAESFALKLAVPARSCAR